MTTQLTKLQKFQIDHNSFIVLNVEDIEYFIVTDNYTDIFLHNTNVRILGNLYELLDLECDDEQNGIVKILRAGPLSATDLRAKLMVRFDIERATKALIYLLSKGTIIKDLNCTMMGTGWYQYSLAKETQS